MRVVIAEDDALLLTSAGHEVVAGTGPEVLPALLEHRPDAVLSQYVEESYAASWRPGVRAGSAI